ncbi:GNAT family N-acetyltransferase [Balneola sp. MJW-20]|uniref:GNAT family N-acetyltransferase n=1 Tax=Gracilimonas aurantiaca TaxID=3234185 RepID=UPI003465AF58
MEIIAGDYCELESGLFIDEISNDQEETYIPVKNEIIGDIRSLSISSEKWDQLAGNFIFPMLQSSWVVAAANAFSESESIQVIISRKGEKVVAALPLASKGLLMPHLEILGSSTLQEPGGFIYDSEESLISLVQFILSLKRPVYLHGLELNSLSVKVLLNELDKNNDYEYRVAKSLIPYVKVEGEWKSFERTISSSRRSSFRRLLRKAESKGRVEFRAVTPNNENFTQYFEEVLRVEAANWKSKAGTAIKINEALEVFFKEYASDLVRKGQLRLFFMNIDNKPIAVQLTAVHANRLWIFKIGYDENWKFCSPGILLMNYVVKYCFEAGLDHCEFLGNDEEWLHTWANETHELVNFTIYPVSLRGALAKIDSPLGYLMGRLKNAKYKWYKLNKG